MSYEGYDQILCENGHLSIYDAFTSPIGYGEDHWECGVCGADMAWWGGVDETNGEDEETHMCPGEVDFKMKGQPTASLCKHCGAIKNEPATYEIPEGVGHRIGGKHGQVLG